MTEMKKEQSKYTISTRTGNCDVIPGSLNDINGFLKSLHGYMLEASENIINNGANEKEAV